jgi:hypothetical protein
MLFASMRAGQGEAAEPACWDALLAHHALGLRQHERDAGGRHRADRRRDAEYDLDALEPFDCDAAVKRFGFAQHL